MIEELSYKDVIYEFNFNKDRKIDNFRLPEYEKVFDKIKNALEIDNIGYNIYIIDDFSMDKLNILKDYIHQIYKDKSSPQDICYVIYDNENSPKPLFLSNGKGSLLKKEIEKIKNVIYEITYNFYNESNNKSKEEIINSMQKIKSERIGVLTKKAEEYGFEIRYTKNGFTFIPVNEDKIMTEREFDSLDSERKNAIIDKVNILKNMAKDIIKELKDVEDVEINKIKELLRLFYTEKFNELKNEYRDEFNSDILAIEYLDFICDDIMDKLIGNYTTDFDDDEEEINKIINAYEVNVLIDNSENKHPVVIFEDDPKISNLIGNLEYENQNGNYSTDISMIKAGSLLKANEGCLIIRMNSLIENPSSYYYLKKAIITGKIDIDYNKSYAELLALKSIDPEPIPIKSKVIIIGDYSTYDVLYNYDEDFKKIFKLKVEYNPIVDISEENKTIFLNDIMKICSEKEYKAVTDDGVKEIARYLSKKAENKKKIYFDDLELNKILDLANSNVADKDLIDSEDIINAINEEDNIEKEILESFREKKILIQINDRVVGQVNGLSVVDLGYVSFGKPIKITCSCYRGEGNIIDVQKESNLSGSIHSKSINILKGCLSNIIYKYDRMSVDFHVCFEQVYGKIDGDSASVAEMISMLSAISKIPVRQDIAVTGSINQFGQVQPIGGVNEKIEGFYKICKNICDTGGKGVLIPWENKNDLVLIHELEEEIKKGSFHIYTMRTIEDAVDTMMGAKNIHYNDIMLLIQKEIKKYSPGKKR